MSDYDDLDYPAKPRLWAIVEKNIAESEKLEIKMVNIERGLDHVVSCHSDIMRALKEIIEWQRAKDVSTTKTDATLMAHEKEIAQLWAFPLKVAAAILVLFGASASVYGFLKWFIPGVVDKVGRGGP